DGVENSLADPELRSAPRDRLVAIFEGGRLVHYQRRRPDRLVLLLAWADAAEDRCVTGRGVGEHPDRGGGGRAAAPGEHDVDVAAVGRGAAPAFADPPVQVVEVHRAPS